MVRHHGSSQIVFLIHNDRFTDSDPILILRITFLLPEPGCPDTIEFGGARI
jgi:hypothetical protein